MDFTTSVNRCQLLIRPLKDLLDRAVVTHRADWRCHKFPARVQVLLSVAAQLDRWPSGQALIEELNELDYQGHDRQHRQLVDFDHLDYWGQPLTINQSSWSRANAACSWRLWRYLFHRLLALVRTALSPAQLGGLSSLGKLMAVDGSLSDCLPKTVWALYRSHSNKVKAHFFHEILTGLPLKLVLTSGKADERAVLEEHFQPNRSLGSKGTGFYVSNKKATI